MLWGALERLAGPWKEAAVPWTAPLCAPSCSHRLSSTQLELLCVWGQVQSSTCTMCKPGSGPVVWRCSMGTPHLHSALSSGFSGHAPRAELCIKWKSELGCPWGKCWTHGIGEVRFGAASWFLNCMLLTASEAVIPDSYSSLHKMLTKTYNSISALWPLLKCSSPWTGFLSCGPWQLQAPLWLLGKQLLPFHTALLELWALCTLSPPKNLSIH